MVLFFSDNFGLVGVEYVEYVGCSSKEFTTGDDGGVVICGSLLPTAMISSPPSCLGSFSSSSSCVCPDCTRDAVSVSTAH
jgi:hypothetical protein